MWKESEGLGSGVSWAGEQNATAEGTWKESRPQEKQGTIVGEDERKRGGPCPETQRVVYLWCRLWLVRGHLLRPQETRHLLCGLRAAGG